MRIPVSQGIKEYLEQNKDARNKLWQVNGVEQDAHKL